MSGNSPASDQLRFWCNVHQELCTSSRSDPRVVCEHGHLITESFDREPWAFCSGCRTFLERRASTGILECGACERRILSRHLCAKCELVFLEAEKPQTRRPSVDREGVTGRCPLCDHRRSEGVREHDCEELKARVTVEGRVCGLCNERVEPSTPPEIGRRPAHEDQFVRSANHGVGGQTLDDLAEPLDRFGNSTAVGRPRSAVIVPVGNEFQSIANQEPEPPPTTRRYVQFLVVALAIVAMLAVAAVLWVIVRPAQKQDHLFDGTTISATRDNNQIEAFLERWRLSWEKGDIEAYSGFYADDFKGRLYSSSGGYRVMKRQQWLQDKAEKFTKAVGVEIQFSDVRIQWPTNQLQRDVTVTFIQRYRSLSYADRGRKLLLVRLQDDGRVLITAEDFTPSPGK